MQPPHSQLNGEADREEFESAPAYRACIHFFFVFLTCRSFIGNGTRLYDVPGPPD